MSESLTPSERAEVALSNPAGPPGVLALAADVLNLVAELAACRVELATALAALRFYCDPDLPDGGHAASQVLDRHFEGRSD